jgi:putative CocE/NonD family hydrolase
MIEAALGGMQLEWGVRIPLRDGVCLNATMYHPEPPRQPGPCIVTLTPYVADRYHPRGVFFATHGFPFLVVDVRGRGNSEGEFSPYLQEARDGYDVVEWLAARDYCDGQVAMWGGSYSGYNQWVTAKEFPPHLVTIVPAAAAYMGVDFPMRNNIFYPYLMQWITFTSGRTAQESLFADAALWSEIYLQWFRSGRRFRDLDAIVGNPSPVFQQWCSHPEPDAFWDAYNPSDEEYARLRLPILTITGSYDDDQPGAIEHYNRHRRSASAADRGRHFLIIGPWDHQATTTPRASIGGVPMGPASRVDLPELHLAWYAWTMQKGPRPAFLRKSVAYYVMGAEQWNYADTLEEITSHHESRFLDSTGTADDLYSGGTLGLAIGIGSPDSYRYDPGDTHGSEVDAMARADAGSLVHQGLAVALRGKALFYHSAPFETDTQISGFFRLSVWMSIDCPDTDLYVSVYEIARDGGAIRLSTDAMRARYREGLRTPRLVQTQAPLRYDFTRFTFVSRAVKRGHRLRLIVAPVGHLVETTFAQRNFNAGGVVADESVQESRPVTVTVLHDHDHPSALYVPIGQSAAP